MLDLNLAVRRLAWSAYVASPKIPTPGADTLHCFGSISTGQGGANSITNEPTGWGEDNNWVTVPSTGCVVFPHVWYGDNGPGQRYGVDGRPEYPTGGNNTNFLMGSSRLTLTAVCPATGGPDPASYYTRIVATLTDRRGFGCDAGWNPPGGDDDGASLSGGEIFGIVLLIFVIVAGAVLGWMWRRNRQEASAGRTPKYPRIASYTLPKKRYDKAKIAKVPAAKPPQLAPKHANRGFHLGLRHNVVPKHDPLEVRSTS